VKIDIIRDLHSLRGVVIKYGDNINTDAIIPSKYLDTPDPDYFNAIMTGLDPEFPSKIKKTYQEHKLPIIIVAGKNFGSGSSREQAAEGLKTTTLATMAESFGTIFFRNCMNVGYPAINITGLSDRLDDGYIIELNLHTGVLQILKPTKESIHFNPIEPFLIKRLEQGGLLPELKDLVIKLGLN